MENLNLELYDLALAAGGRFRLVSLMQKRLRELQQGAPPLVENIENLADYEIVAEEIRQKKIWLITGKEADEIREAHRKEIEARRDTRRLP